MDKTEREKHSLKLLVLIIERGKGDDAAEFLREMHRPFCYHVYGKGTAPSDLACLFGLGDSLKDVLLTVIPSDTADDVMTRLNERFKLEENGVGIAFTIKLNSVGGMNALKFLSRHGEEQINGQ
jgi:hypothetical protein